MANNKLKFAGKKSYGRLASTSRTVTLFMVFTQKSSSSVIRQDSVLRNKFE